MISDFDLKLLFSLFSITYLIPFVLFTAGYKQKKREKIFFPAFVVIFLVRRHLSSSWFKTDIDRGLRGTRTVKALTS